MVRSVTAVLVYVCSFVWFVIGAVGLIDGLSDMCKAEFSRRINYAVPTYVLGCRIGKWLMEPLPDDQECTRWDGPIKSSSEIPRRCVEWK